MMVRSIQVLSQHMVDFQNYLPKFAFKSNKKKENTSLQMCTISDGRVYTDIKANVLRRFFAHNTYIRHKHTLHIKLIRYGNLLF